MMAGMKDPYHTRPEDREESAAYAQDEVDQVMEAKKKKNRGRVAEFLIDVLGEVIEAIIDAVT